MNPTFKSLLIFCCVALLCSCNAVKLHKTAQYNKSDQQTHVAYDSAHVITSAGLSNTSTAIYNLKDSNGIATAEFSADFYLSDSTGAITVSYDTAGVFVFDPGKNKIKSISAKKLHQHSKQTSGFTEEKQALSNAFKDSLHASGIADSTNHTETATTEKIKETEKIPVVGITILFFAIAFTLIGYKIYKGEIKI